MAAPIRLTSPAARSAYASLKDVANPFNLKSINPDVQKQSQALVELWLQEMSPNPATQASLAVTAAVGSGPQSELVRLLSRHLRETASLLRASGHGVQKSIGEKLRTAAITEQCPVGMVACNPNADTGVGCALQQGGDSWVATTSGAFCLSGATSNAHHKGEGSLPLKERIQIVGKENNDLMAKYPHLVELAREVTLTRSLASQTVWELDFDARDEEVMMDVVDELIGASGKPDRSVAVLSVARMPKDAAGRVGFVDEARYTVAAADGKPVIAINAKEYVNAQPYTEYAFLTYDDVTSSGIDDVVYQKMRNRTLDTMVMATFSLYMTDPSALRELLTFCYGGKSLVLESGSPIRVPFELAWFLFINLRMEKLKTGRVTIRQMFLNWVKEAAQSAGSVVITPADMAKAAYNQAARVNGGKNVDNAKAAFPVFATKEWQAYAAARNGSRPPTGDAFHYAPGGSGRLVYSQVVPNGSSLFPSDYDALTPAAKAAYNEVAVYPVPNQTRNPFEAVHGELAAMAALQLDENHTTPLEGDRRMMQLLKLLDSPVPAAAVTAGYTQATGGAPVGGAGGGGAATVPRRGMVLGGPQGAVPQGRASSSAAGIFAQTRGQMSQAERLAARAGIAQDAAEADGRETFRLDVNAGSRTGGAPMGQSVGLA